MNVLREENVISLLPLFPIIYKTLLQLKNQNQNQMNVLRHQYMISQLRKFPIIQKILLQLKNRKSNEYTLSLGCDKFTPKVSNNYDISSFNTKSKSNKCTVSQECDKSSSTPKSKLDEYTSSDFQSHLRMMLVSIRRHFCLHFLKIRFHSEETLLINYIIILLCNIIKSNL